MNNNNKTVFNQNIYLDHPHVNNIVTRQGKKWYHKVVEAKDVQAREFAVQSLLYPTRRVPLCLEYDKTGFLEEIIYGQALAELENINDVILVSLAETLQSLHAFPKQSDVFIIFSAVEINDYRYSPDQVLNLVLANHSDAELEILALDYDLLGRIARAVTEKIEVLNHQPTIIHGDVSANNVFITPDSQIKLIDWTDCRIDVGISDLSQAIHLIKLDDRQQNIFLAAYKHDFNFPLFIQFQLLMHCLYDLMAKYNRRLPYDQELDGLEKSIAKICCLL